MIAWLQQKYRDRYDIRTNQTRAVSHLRSLFNTPLLFLLAWAGDIVI